MKSLPIFRPRSLVIVGIICTGLLIFSKQPAYAAGVTVSPAILDVGISEATPVQTRSVSVRNDFPVVIRIGTSISGLEQVGKNLVPSSNVDTDLAAATKILTEETTLSPGQSVNLQIQFNDAPEVAPGGHYGALLIKMLPQEDQKLTLQQAISVTMFVVKEGGAIRSVELTDVKLQRNIFRAPKFVDLTFKNTGNVHIVPRGIVSLSSGQVVYSKGIVNEPSSPLFPDRNIILRSSLERVKLPILPGFYSLDVEYRFDDTGRYASESVRFIYVPPWSVGAVIILLFALGFVHGRGWLDWLYAMFILPRRKLSPGRQNRKVKAPQKPKVKKQKFKSLIRDAKDKPKTKTSKPKNPEPITTKTGVEVVSYSRIRARRDR